MKLTLRQILAQLSANPSLLAKHAPQLCRFGFGTVVEMREVGGSGAIAAARRDEMLEKCKAGVHVEIEVDLLAYEQKTGERNRNSVRFRDGAMVSLGRTGKGTPFLRDHNQYDSLSKAGVITSSTTEKRAEGDYCVRQTVKLTAPWAVEQVLRGLMDAVSIGWRPTGPIMCSACNAAVYTKCWHWPGDRLVEKDDEGGGKRKVRAADGPIVVEWIYTEAELVETSMVNIGGVPAARGEDVRASMFASLSASNPGLGIEDLDNDQEHEEEHMKNRLALIALLGLAATASDAEILASLKLGADATDEAVLAAAIAISKKKTETAAAELAIAQGDSKKTADRLATLEADKRQRDEDTFIADALNAGKIAKGDEKAWRALFASNEKRAGELMAERQTGSVTPVGTAPQRANDPEAVPGEVLEITPTPNISGGGVPGYELYERGVRSRSERIEIAKQLAAAVQAVETHQNPKARVWAQRFGYEGRLRNMPAPTLGGTSITNNADLDASRVGFHAAFMQAMEQSSTDPLEMLYTTVPSTGNLETWNWMGDLPAFEEWIGDRKMSGMEAFKLSIANKKWSNGLRVKNDDIKDDKLGLLPSQISGLATKARRHPLDLITQNLLNGNDGTAFPAVGNGLAYDAAFFFADAHRGGNDNKMTVALDAAGLTAGQLLLESMTTYDGNDPLDTHGTHLIVGPKLRATAEKLLQQERLANGEDNYHRGKYKLIVSNRIRSTWDDWWFLADLSQAIRPFIFQMREPISTSAVIGQDGNNSVPSFINDELWFGAQARYNVGYFEFRLIVGSVVA